MVLSCPKKLGQPIQDRYTESEERPKAFDELGKQLQQYMKIVEAFKMKVSVRYCRGSAFLFIYLNVN